MALDILATVVNVVVSAALVLNYRGWTRWAARLVNRCLLVGPVSRVMRSCGDSVTFWVVRGLAMWSAIASCGFVVSLVAR